MRVKIEKLIFEGYGLGHLSDGKPIFVYKSVPGDELEVKLIENKKKFAKGAIEKVIRPSNYRIEPICKYFQQCGGCEHQNISYENQLKFKEEIFRETLGRQGIDTKIENIIPGSESEFYYRNSIRFFFQEVMGGIEFARHNFLYKNGLVKVEKCFLQSETSNKILSLVKNYINSELDGKKPFWQLKIREGKQTGEAMVEIITSSHDLPGKEGLIAALSQITEVKSIYHAIAPSKSLTNLERHLIFGRPIIYEKIGNKIFQISPESFFQTNSLGVETLYEQIKRMASVEIGNTVLDLYCGTGSIGIYLSTLAKKVVGVESIRSAVNDARDNAKLNKVQNCEFICYDATKWLSQNKESFDIIIVDPPRAGLSREIIHKLSQTNWKRLIYTSCNPATFARDIKLFHENGIKLMKVQPIDMFPQTHHIECAGLLEKPTA